MMQPIFFGLPSAAELYDAPQRAILAGLDANLVLAVRALLASHPDLHGYTATTEPLPALAEAVLACALSLHDVLASYDELAGRLARPDHDSEPDDVDGDDTDIPF